MLRKLLSKPSLHDCPRLIFGNAPALTSVIKIPMLVQEFHYIGSDIPFKLLLGHCRLSRLYLFQFLLIFLENALLRFSEPLIPYQSSHTRYDATGRKHYSDPWETCKSHLWGVLSWNHRIAVLFWTIDKLIGCSCLYHLAIWFIRNRKVWVI